jgi:aminoglycoside phosphotransferase (APT) family kinase protein
MSEGTDGRAGVTADLVRRLIADQAPQWAALPVDPVLIDGWDNRTYRLGSELTVRLPTHERYVAAVAKEAQWLPVLAPHLPVPIPEPLFTGRPGQGYPFPWSVRRWLLGEPARIERLSDVVGFAREVGEFLVALRRVSPLGGPPAGAHSFHRGASLAFYDDETRRCLADSAEWVDTARAAAVWADVAVGNLLVDRGRLAAVIDFGTCGVGDPSCDLVIAWTFFSGESRRAFQESVDQDAGAWARARGWALWKALLGVHDNQQDSMLNSRSSTMS